jgi:hypothetical protein
MIPAGWKLVPIEPTDDMLVSGQEAWVHRARTAVEDCEEARVVYAAMVDVAPSPAADEGSADRGELVAELKRLVNEFGWIRAAFGGADGGSSEALKAIHEGTVLHARIGAAIDALASSAEAPADEADALAVAYSQGRADANEQMRSQAAIGAPPAASTSAQGEAFPKALRIALEDLDGMEPVGPSTAAVLEAAQRWYLAATQAPAAPVVAPSEPIDEKQACVAAFARTYPWEGEEVVKLAGAKVAVWRDSTIRALDRHAVFKQGWLARASYAHANNQGATVPATDTQAGPVRSALAELVALKDLKDEELRVRQRKEVSIRRVPDELARVNAMRDDYNRRKPLAWDRARAALGQAGSTEGES